MNTGDTNTFEQAHLEKWLETTRLYLFSALESHAGAAGKAPLAPKLDSHGAQDRFISRVRGRMLRLVKHTPQHDRNALRELERVFYFQALFVSRHPEVPRRLLGWLSQGSDTRIRRRVRKIIGHFESRLCRMIAQAKQQGCIRADIDPCAAAGVFIGMIQGLALRLNVNLRQREPLLREAFESFSVYRAGMVFASK